MANTGCKQEGPPWSDLPVDLMEFILQNCDFRDQVRLRAVCKTWQSIPRVQPHTKLPWLMASNDQNWSTCKLLDLTYKESYTVNLSTMIKYLKETKRGHVRVCASRSGWLLVSHFIYETSNTEFFLYSPFTNRMLKLPHLDTLCFWGGASFSADPTSADCVFFILYYSVCTHKDVASTCRLGDTTWTTHEFPLQLCIINNVVYSVGQFWCATSSGKLVALSVAQGIWNVLELRIPNPELHFNVVDEETYLVESNGDLLLVLISYKHKSIHVFKLDRSQMAWILVEDIGDQTLFLGPTSLSVSEVPAKLGLTGKIYYSWGSKCIFLREYHPKSKIWIEPPI